MWISIRIGFYMGIYFSFSFGLLTLSCWRSLGKRVVYSIGPAGLGGQTSADSPGTTGKTGNSVVYAAWDIHRTPLKEVCPGGFL